MEDGNESDDARAVEENLSLFLFFSFSWFYSFSRMFLLSMADLNFLFEAAAADDDAGVEVESGGGAAAAVVGTHRLRGSSNTLLSRLEVQASSC